MKPQRVDMDPEAESYWVGVYQQLRQDRPGLAGAVTARGPALVLRLALIYAVLDRPKQPTIKVEHLRAAMAVWQYNCDSVELLFDSKTGDKLGDKLYHLIRSNGQMTRKGFHKHLSNAQKTLLRETLQRLEAQGLVCSERVTTKGRPKEIWKIAENPPL